MCEEFGEAHSRVFVTRCTVGEHTCEGKGSKKKSSKQDAARVMLIKLKELGPLPAGTILHKPKSYSIQATKKKTKIIKVIKKIPAES